MATSSFTNRVSLNNDEAKKLTTILSNTTKIKKPIEVKNHKEVKGSAIKKFLGVSKWI